MSTVCYVYDVLSEWRCARVDVETQADLSDESRRKWTTRREMVEDDTQTEPSVPPRPTKNKSYHDDDDEEDDDDEKRRRSKTAKRRHKHDQHTPSPSRKYRPTYCQQY